ncbi:Alpha/beta hydrolase fold-1 [Cynara cardunculus var. scolymus]|uniref:Alpha/beta hydrolase fold-1 n=1 Tax=Cynara cardunculus var. scolymus TaxID=59895 RepID=A0A103XQ03_CYNCS|nr:Alpha/beta hydrolase fold-1 [Cynara cardunculus var. scolymus]
MVRCINFTASRDWCLARSFASAGLKSTTTTLHDGDTTIHCWIPKTHKPNKPNLLLVHGIGANAKWQWDPIISRVTPLFNVYVPDLLFYGDSYTRRPERTEHFQAECVMRTLESVGLIGKINLVGLSYGGFVGYSMANQFPEAIERVVIVGSGVSLDSEIDLEEGLFSSKNIKDAANILLAQTPEKTRELLRISFYKPPPPNLAPSCLINDFIDEMNVDYFEEKRECIEAVQKDRKFSDLPKIIQQPTLIVWGENDAIFPLDLGHLGEGAELIVLKKTGHAMNMEQPKELCRLFKLFLIQHSLPQS